MGIARAVLFGTLVLGCEAASRYGMATDAFEIQVYDGHINGIGEYTLENHVNHVFSAKVSPDFEGQISYDQLTHWTFEFARGMTDYWELGAYFQTALSSAPQLYYSGFKLRSKFVLPGVDTTHVHLGLNIELSTVPQLFEEYQYALELRPIIGHSWEDWTVLFNPILGVALSGDSHVPSFEPALKVFYDTHHFYALGLEYYGDFGPLNVVGGLSTQEHYFFGAFDLIGKPLELNIGIGTGVTDASNGWIAKTIVGFTL